MEEQETKQIICKSCGNDKHHENATFCNVCRESLYESEMELEIKPDYHDSGLAVFLVKE